MSTRSVECTAINLCVQYSICGVHSYQPLCTVQYLWQLSTFVYSTVSVAAITTFVYSAVSVECTAITTFVYSAVSVAAINLCVQYSICGSYHNLCVQCSICGVHSYQPLCTVQYLWQLSQPLCTVQYLWQLSQPLCTVQYLWSAQLSTFVYSKVSVAAIYHNLCVQYSAVAVLHLT